MQKDNLTHCKSNRCQRPIETLDVKTRYS